MFLSLLKEIDQQHIVQAYLQADTQQQQELDQQLQKIENNYPGGLKLYYQHAKELLHSSAEGSNPYANYDIIKQEEGVVMNYDDLSSWEKMETIGLQQIKHVCFVLVAGGLGQRLGYPGIKISIPKELLTKKSFLKYYCEYVRAYEIKFCQNEAIPFCIMTSEDTHQKTIDFLESNEYFGLKKYQVTLLQQEKVPALIDNDAHFSLLPNKLKLQTKPHGHGDIHILLHKSGLAAKWFKEGRKWIAAFQDTNPFALRSFPLLLGISEVKNFDFNTFGILRKPGEALGAITTFMQKSTKKLLTINVEYNQIQAVFKEVGGQPLNPDGTSKLPGNSNCFAIKLSTYVQALQRTQGLIKEFINPKYADSSKNKFKSSARLECMMQDYPKLLHNCDKVGFVRVPKGYCFSALKNDLASSTLKHQQGISGEGAPHMQVDIYTNNRNLLKLCGAKIQQSKPELVSGSELAIFPMVSFSPFFATCLTELKQKVKKLWIHPRSSLIIESDCVLENVQVDGHLDIRDQGNITVKHLQKNYHSLQELDEDEQEPHLRIRGYKLKLTQSQQ